MDIRKIGFPVSRDGPDGKLAPHFAKAKWILIYQKDGRFYSIRNKDLTGRGVVDTFVRCGCTDAVVLNIGKGALRNLEAQGIRGWYGDEEATVRELVDRLRGHRLRAAVEPNQHGRGERHRGWRLPPASRGNELQVRHG